MTAAIIPEGAIAGDTGAAELARAIEDKVQGLRDIAGRVADFLVQFRAMKIADGDSGSAARDAALAELDQLRGGADAVHQGLLLLIEDALNVGVPTPGTLSNALIEKDLDQAWVRARAELERADGEQQVWETVERLATVAAEREDKTTLQALRGQLPHYLSQRGFDQVVPRVRPRIDEIEAPMLPPRMRVAALARAAIETGWPRILAAFDLARGEVGKGNAPVRQLPGFAPDETMALPDR